MSIAWLRGWRLRSTRPAFEWQVVCYSEHQLLLRRAPRSAGRCLLVHPVACCTPQVLPRPPFFATCQASFFWIEYESARHRAPGPLPWAGCPTAWGEQGAGAAARPRPPPPPIRATADDPPWRSPGRTMELHILEHRLQVASVAKESIPLFTYGLIKLAFLSSKTR